MPLFAARLDSGKTDLILACDMVVASSAAVLSTVRTGETKAVLNLDVTPTGAFQTNRDADISADHLGRIIAAAVGEAGVYNIPATRVATALFGDSIATNFLMVGYALQMGLLPVSLRSVEDAIRLNGMNVTENLRTLSLGRLIAHNPAQLEEDLAPSVDLDHSYNGIVARYSRLLTDYQDTAYALRYSEHLAKLSACIPQGLTVDSTAFKSAVAATLGRLMAYKDEYEVARLYTSPDFTNTLRSQFAEYRKLRFHLSPPLLARIDPSSGRPRKMSVGGWIMPLFKLLTKMRALRGTLFDPFGYTAERRQERALIPHYLELVLTVAARLTDANVGSAIALVSEINEVRGYGPVKEAAMMAYKAKVRALQAAFEQEGAGRDD
jgi:indolepyruvate ferredoxin oxidoreductase